jgi:hypothetical protein
MFLSHNWIGFKIDTNWITNIFIFTTSDNCDSTKCWNSLFIVFSNSQSLSSIIFESESRLTRIESNAFSSVWLETIVLPWNDEVLCSRAETYNMNRCDFLISYQDLCWLIFRFFRVDETDIADLTCYLDHFWIDHFCHLISEYCVVKHALCCTSARMLDWFHSQPYLDSSLSKNRKAVGQWILKHFL